MYGCFVVSGSDEFLKRPPTRSNPWLSINGSNRMIGDDLGRSLLSDKVLISFDRCCCWTVLIQNNRAVRISSGDSGFMRDFKLLLLMA